MQTTISVKNTVWLMDTGIYSIGGSCADLQLGFDYFFLFHIIQLLENYPIFNYGANKYNYTSTKVENPQKYWEHHTV